MPESPTATPPASGTADDFYVGYLVPPPRSHARRVRITVAALGLLIASLGIGIGAAQSDAGDGVWESQERELTGLFWATPYPMIRIAGEGGKQSRAILLVGQGKCAAFSPEGACGLMGGSLAPDAIEAVRSQMMARFDGKLVRIRGTLIRRDDRELFELSEGERAAATADDPALAATLADPTGTKTFSSPLTLEGWVVDPKCYLGAMRPGFGKTHLACAVRCISGGIPPALVGAKGWGFLVLADQEGRPIDRQVLPFVGTRVRATGVVEYRHGMPVFCTDAGLMSPL